MRNARAILGASSVWHPGCVVLHAPSWPSLMHRPPPWVSSLVSSMVRHPGCICLGALSWWGSVLLLSSLGTDSFLAMPVPVPITVVPLVVIVAVLGTVWAVPIAVGAGMALLSPPHVSLLSSVV